MGHFFSTIQKILSVAVIVPGLAFGVQAPNPRSTTNNTKNIVRNTNTDSNVSVRRSATSVIARSVALNGRKDNTVVRARSAVSQRTPNNISVRPGANVFSNNATVSRAAISKSNTTARSAIKQSKQINKIGLSRSAKSRATAVFDDVSKIGGGYASCRDAYATCMDQFCAIASDTYRRCYCSDKFVDLRDTSDNIDTALGLLVDFQNNNLNAVNKTAAEVDAMYSSTVGEMAIKKDTSASQKMLDEIGDILSGKKTKKKNSSASSSLGIIDFSSLADTGDIWSSNGSTAFSSRASDGMAGLEGRALYKRASNQCANLVGSTCASDTMFNLASSAYSIMVTQDCNAIEKTINAKKENLMQTVRKAEQVLREARLEEYRAHNSRDVNECLNKVEIAMTDAMACGPNYEKCLDYTGLYINATTGEPISHQLFDLNKIAPVLGDVDIIESNPRWDEFLERKKDRASMALDTCRNLADDVWVEYKRSAMIRIAQMQDAKIEQFKSSCVQTIKECYNSNDGTLADMTDGMLDDTAYDVSATRAVTVRNMCYQDVLACAAMYGDVNGCEYNPNTRKIGVRKGGGKCGLTALLAYVDSVDTARVAQGCETALIAKTHDMCDPINSATITTTTTSDRSAVLLARAPDRTKNLGPTSDGVPEYLTMTYEEMKSAGTSSSSASSTTTTYSTTVTEKYPAGCKDWQLSKIKQELYTHADEFCAVDLVQKDTANVNYSTSTMNIEIIRNTIRSVYERLCMDLGYTSQKCHGSYGNDDWTPKTSSGKTTSTSTPSAPEKDPLEEANEDYQEKVEGNKGAGYGIGGWGNAQVTDYLEQNLDLASKMQLRLDPSGDMRGQLANFYEQGNPYAYGNIYQQGINAQQYLSPAGQSITAAGDPIMSAGMTNGAISVGSMPTGSMPAGSMPSGTTTGVVSTITDNALGATVSGVSNAMTQQNYGY